MLVYAFDVDNSLNLVGMPTAGPIEISDIVVLKNAGHIVGVCGNSYFLFKYMPQWYEVFSFVAPLMNQLVSKAAWLYTFKNQLQRTNPQIVDFVMVGNKLGTPGVLPSSMDNEEAKLAGWRFIPEVQFSKGMR